MTTNQLEKRVQHLTRTVDLLHQQTRLLFDGLKLHQDAILNLAKLEQPKPQPARTAPLTSMN